MLFVKFVYEDAFERQIRWVGVCRVMAGWAERRVQMLKYSDYQLDFKALYVV